MYKYTDGGLRNVWLVNGYRIHKTPYGEAVSIDDLDGLTDALCNAFARKKKPLSQTEFRYLRTSGLMLSQAALGSTLGVDAQTVARWEKCAYIPKMADKLIRLIYLEHANGNVRLKAAFEAIQAVERAKNGPHPPARVIAESKGKSWETRLDDSSALDGEGNPSPAEAC